jgi:hypothetical protein
MLSLRQLKILGLMQFGFLKVRRQKILNINKRTHTHTHNCDRIIQLASLTTTYNLRKTLQFPSKLGSNTGLNMFILKTQKSLKNFIRLS